jgi:hypothetical protein
MIVCINITKHTNDSMYQYNKTHCYVLLYWYILSLICFVILIHTIIDMFCYIDTYYHWYVLLYWYILSLICFVILMHTIIDMFCLKWSSHHILYLRLCLQCDTALRNPFLQNKLTIVYSIKSVEWYWISATVDSREK